MRIWTKLSANNRDGGQKGNFKVLVDTCRDFERCEPGMTWQLLSSKWSAAKARRGSMSFWTCDQDATQAPDYFQLNPSGHSSLHEFPRKNSLDQPRMLSGQGIARLEFAQIPCGNWQAIPVSQH
jgi:hypothetical protein